MLSTLLVQAQPPDANGDTKGDAKGGGGGKAFKAGGGYAPKNLQVLDNNTFPNSMQSFVQALGVAEQGRCNYCHVEGEKASDGCVTSTQFPGRQAARDLLDVPPRQHHTGNGALGETGSLTSRLGKGQLPKRARLR